jgi:hypothetical protein
MHLTRRGWTLVAGVIAIAAIFVIAPPTGVAMAAFFVALVTIGVALREAPAA